MTISVKLLTEILSYDGISGDLTWKSRPVDMFKDGGNRSAQSYCDMWNNRYKGKNALTAICSSGYKHGHILGKDYRAHRVAMAIKNGRWPKEFVDHLDGNKLNNSAHNLRGASPLGNQQNTSSRSGSTSEYLGVSWQSRDAVWVAQIRVNGKQTRLGSFSCPIKAAKAYDIAAQKYHGEFANPNFKETK